MEVWWNLQNNSLWYVDGFFWFHFRQIRKSVCSNASVGFFCCCVGNYVSVQVDCSLRIDQFSTMEWTIFCNQSKYLTMSSQPERKTRSCKIVIQKKLVGLFFFLSFCSTNNNTYQVIIDSTNCSMLTAIRFVFPGPGDEHYEHRFSLSKFISPVSITDLAIS